MCQISQFLRIVSYVRRNLSDFVKYELAQVKAGILRERGKENLKTPTGGKSSLTLSTFDKVVEPHNTQKEVAKDLGWSTGKTALLEDMVFIELYLLNFEILHHLVILYHTF